MQFGRTLDRVLYNIWNANLCYGSVYLSKIDLGDGFYQVGIENSSVTQLVILMPIYLREEP